MQSVTPVLDFKMPSKQEQSKQANRAHEEREDRKSTRLNSSHVSISYAVFCLKKKKLMGRIFHLYVAVHLLLVVAFPRRGLAEVRALLRRLLAALAEISIGSLSGSTHLSAPS